MTFHWSHMCFWKFILYWMDVNIMNMSKTLAEYLHFRKHYLWNLFYNCWICIWYLEILNENRKLSLSFSLSVCLSHSVCSLSLHVMPILILTRRYQRCVVMIWGCSQRLFRLSDESCFAKWTSSVSWPFHFLKDKYRGSDIHGLKYTKYICIRLNRRMQC